MVSPQSPDGRRQDGYFPIHRACWGRKPQHTDTVRVFVEVAGIPFDMKTRDGKTCAQITPNEGTLAFLQKRAAAAAADEL